MINLIKFLIGFFVMAIVLGAFAVIFYFELVQILCIIILIATASFLAYIVGDTIYKEFICGRDQE